VVEGVILLALLFSLIVNSLVFLSPLAYDANWVAYFCGLCVPNVVIFVGLLTLCLLNVLNATQSDKAADTTSGTGSNDTGF
jgi:hypothetical protein